MLAESLSSYRDLHQILKQIVVILSGLLQNHEEEENDDTNRCSRINLPRDVIVRFFIFVRVVMSNVYCLFRFFRKSYFFFP